MIVLWIFLGMCACVFAIGVVGGFLIEWIMDPPEGPLPGEDA